MDSISTARRIRELEITTRQLVDGLVSGGHDSMFRGRGIEFDEIREYQHGDDVRAMDWNVTARLDKPHIKEFIEERDMQVYVIVDMSASGSFGSSESKQKRIAEVTASLVFAAQRSNDRIGIVLVTDRIEMFMPARRGRKHAMRVLYGMLSHAPGSKMTDLRACLESTIKILKKRSIVVLISDMIDDGDYARPLRHISHRHDTIVIRVTDVRERDIPDVGMIELEDAETGEQILVDTSDADFRRAYTEISSHRESTLSSVLTRCHTDHIMIDTDSDYVPPLLHFFRTRNRRNHGRI